MNTQQSDTDFHVPRHALTTYCRKNQIHWMAVFGSALGHEFTSDSDIDLLVEFDADAQIGFLDLSRIQRELAEIWGRPVDLVPRNGLNPAIRQQVLESAQTLYAA